VERTRTHTRGGIAMQRVYLFPGLAGAVMVYLLAAGCIPNYTSPILIPFCGAVTKPFCEAAHACCTTPSELVRRQWGTTIEECTAPPRGLSRACVDDDLGGAIERARDAGLTVLDEALLDKCVTMLKQSVSGGVCLTPAGELLRNECLGAFRGQIPPGGACAW